MATITVENYLKTLYMEQQRLAGEATKSSRSTKLVPMGTLAEAMQVAPGTVTSMVKTLEDSGLAEYQPREGVKLTTSGRKLALHVLRRHRLVELFLVEVLGLDWSEVHDEAEELEHAISEKVLERIDAYLGNPTADPHGDPIPSSTGAMVRQTLETLADCQTDRSYQLARVTNQDAKFLRFADSRGLTPGIDLVVVERDAVADAVTVQPNEGGALVIGMSAARMFQVVIPEKVKV
jgi:DtxR family transcriptional regulator, Mn-dependent transcriptional regulator